MSRIIMLLMVLILICSLSACSYNKNADLPINKEKEVESNNAEVSTVKSEEEMIWEDAQKDEIFNEEITIKGNITILETEEFVSNEKVVDSKTKEKEESYFDLNVINLKAKEDNRFAKKFLDLLNESSVYNIVVNGENDLKRFLLFSYLNIRLNHYEGIGIYSNWITDNYKELEAYNLINIYCQNFSDGKLLEDDSFYKYSPNFIFEFVDESGNKLFVRTRGSLQDKYSSTDSSFDMRYFDSFDEIIEREKDNSRDFILVDKKTIDETLFNNKDFIEFYIRYKKDYYYPRYDEEHSIKGSSDKLPENKKSKPKIGMSEFEVRASSWGEPNRINKNTYSWGTTEQWVYDNGYIYFEDGFVTSISESY